MIALAAALRRPFDSLRQDPVRTLLMAVALAVVGWLVLYPLFILFRMGMHDKAGHLTLANYVAVFTEPRLLGALLNSVIVSLATTIACLVLALPLAWGWRGRGCLGGGWFRLR